jgi:hypothetical protein
LRRLLPSVDSKLGEQHFESAKIFHRFVMAIMALEARIATTTPRNARCTRFQLLDSAFPISLSESLRFLVQKLRVTLTGFVARMSLQCHFAVRKPVHVIFLKRA